MYPRRRALDDRLPWLEASGIDPDVIMADAGACGLYVTVGDCGDLVVLDTELEVHRALHRRAVLRLDEKDARLSCGPHARMRRCHGGSSERAEDKGADNSHDESPLLRDAHSGPSERRVHPTSPRTANPTRRWSSDPRLRAPSGAHDLPTQRKTLNPPLKP